MVLLFCAFLTLVSNHLATFVNNLKVVNYCAERSIKDITEFKDFTEDPTEKEYILSVAEYHHSGVI